MRVLIVEDEPDLLRAVAQSLREAGYAAIMVAMLVPTVFLGLAALGVDTARWYVEAERMQKAYKEFVDKIRKRYPVWTVFDNPLQKPRSTEEDDRYSSR